MLLLITSLVLSPGLCVQSLVAIGFLNVYIFCHTFVPIGIIGCENNCSVFCLCFVCIFLFASKWLIIETESPKGLKTVYQVLKFATKHKTPLNRSALTYWEEDMPSCLDLGKSRYGGPFTTEQVENVKTFFKMLVMHLPIFFACIALNSTQNVGLVYNIWDCTSGIEYSLVYMQSLVEYCCYNCGV